MPNAHRIVIADSAVFVRRALTELLEHEPGFSIVGVAQTVNEAYDRLQLKPEVLIVDPDLAPDPLAFTRNLRKRDPNVSIVLYSRAQNRSVASECARLGQVEYVTKPETDGRRQSDAERELISKVRLCLVRTARASLAPKANARQSGKTDIIVVASSTGGPAALVKALGPLPATLAAPVVVVQHMPTDLFTQSLVTSLQGACALRVHHAASGGALAPGGIWVAPGGKHLMLTGGKRSTCMLLTSDAPINGVRPAADPLFTSAVEIFGAGVLGVVLTGMGKDGLRGAECIVRAGGTVLVQDQATSVVWGMPGCIAEAGLATSVLPLNRIAREITARANGAAAAPLSIRPRE